MSNVWCTETQQYIPCPSDPKLVKVWNMHTQAWVQLQEYMRYCSYIWTKGLDWDMLYPKPERVKRP